jgi:hypothetical protein
MSSLTSYVIVVMRTDLVRGRRGQCATYRAEATGVTQRLPEL